MNYWLLLIPFISGFIGYITNLVAIKMLFHPKNPVNILGIKVQGIFPKRQQQFAEKLGKLVGQELLSFAEIEAQLTANENLTKLTPVVEQHLDNFLRHKLSAEMPIISAFIGEKTIQKLKAVFLEEMNLLFPDLMKKYAQHLEEDLDLERIVTEKVSNFSSEKLEGLLYQIMSKEFRFVEIIGAVLGFLIGLLQIGITLLTQ
ncbi:MAG: DUF445 family protein [Chitinophagaceae bacterium]|jgi:uncharacterized membrane protein YheB (UPF0754 family)|nr:DUF445 family protein [Chitinophagaceae bacterium]